MRFVLLLLMLVVSFSAPSEAAVVAGDSCGILGQTKMSEDQLSILACLKTSATDPSLRWKGMQETVPTALNVVKTTTTLCRRHGTYNVIADCPAGTRLIGCGGGPGDQYEDSESWYLDPDFVNNRCVGYLIEPACSSAADQTRVSAICIRG